MEHRWTFSCHSNAKDLVAEERKGPCDSPCWEITSHKKLGSSTRVNIPFHGKRTVAARVIYMYEKGDIPEGCIVRHVCDNPMCVNPEHLLTGTKGDNTQDMLERGRHKHGEKASWAKLTLTAVKFIRELPYKPGMFSMLSVLLEVNEVTIRDVYYGRTWQYD